MTGARLIYWGAVAAALMVYLAMVVWTLPEISQAADGLVPFDLRPWGYGPDAAQGFLDALSDEGRALYLGPQRVLDAIYPALLAVALGGAVPALYRNRALRSVLVIAVLAGMAADYLENARVAALLALQVPAPQELIAAASRATVVKSAATGVAMLAVLIGLVRASLRRWRR